MHRYACKHESVGKVHGVGADTQLDQHAAREVASVMAALGTASRVQILGRLRVGACTVTELTAAVGMAQPAVSHQLRILRDLGLVVGNRDGRTIVYGLHDSHVAVLLDEALRHIEHLRTGAAATPDAGLAPSRHPPPPPTK